MVEQDGRREQVALSVSLAEAGERVDKWLASSFPELSRSAVQRLIEDGSITVGGRVPKKNERLPEGTEVLVCLEPPKETAILPENIPLDILYEDRDLLIVNKPKGMVVHPAYGNETGTLVNALLFHCKDSLSGINGEIRPGIVHRIDKDTSGLLIVAKSDHAHRGLAQQIKEHSFAREYEAVCYGGLKEDSGTVDMPIGRSRVDRKKMAVCENWMAQELGYRRAVTHYKVLERFWGFTYLSLQLETGRTHQIRVHLAALGHPLAGDPVYGPKKVLTELHGQCLHAKRIGFIHPITGKWLEFSVPPPSLFLQFLQKLRDHSLSAEL